MIIQTYNPYHQILQQVTTNDYTTMFTEQIEERRQYNYPPFYRIIKITLKHKNYTTVDSAANWLGDSLKNYFSDWVLGPSSPAVSRIRNLYIKDLMIKIPQNQSIVKTKSQLQTLKNHFQSIAQYRSIRFVIDVDSR